MKKNDVAIMKNVEFALACTKLSPSFDLIGIRMKPFVTERAEIGTKFQVEHRGYASEIFLRNRRLSRVLLRSDNNQITMKYATGQTNVSTLLYDLEEQAVESEIVEDASLMYKEKFNSADECEQMKIFKDTARRIAQNDGSEKILTTQNVEIKKEYDVFEAMEIHRQKRIALSRARRMYGIFQKIESKNGTYEDANEFVRNLVGMEMGIVDSTTPRVSFEKFGEGCRNSNPKVRRLYMPTKNILAFNERCVISDLESGDAVDLIVGVGHEMFHFHQLKGIDMLDDYLPAEERIEARRNRQSYACDGRNDLQIYQYFFKFMCVNCKGFTEDEEVKKILAMTDEERKTYFDDVRYSFYSQNYLEEMARVNAITFVSRFFEEVKQALPEQEEALEQKRQDERYRLWQKEIAYRDREYPTFKQYVRMLERFGYGLKFDWNFDYKGKYDGDFLLMRNYEKGKTFKNLDLI